MKVGFVAILGKPNVGKSTLLNALISKKVSIVSPKAQTTRDSISGIYNDSKRQIVFIDTPGIFSSSVKIDRYMRKVAFESSDDVNAIVYVLDASAKSLDEDFATIDSIKSNAPKIFVLNKIDLVRPAVGKKILEQMKERYPEDDIIEACFIENFGLKELKNLLDQYLEEGNPYYQEGYYTDKDLAFQAKEVIREKLLHFLKQEIPHQSAVLIEKFEEKDGAYVIKAKLIVNRESHKGIVIGKNGEMIKKISMAARHELERMWHTHIASLEIEVEAVPDWRNNSKILNSLGYEI
ncbi:MAG: GTPase Era [Bacilli bacterium]|nr:GTPase Era [Bacilli bacterium]MDY6430685.1 GTPase Era [Bacilli bacterium]